MQTLVLDTNCLIKNLEQRGFSRAQVEAITDALKELHASSLITKSHLSDAVHVLQVAFEKPLHRQTCGIVMTALYCTRRSPRQNKAQASPEG